MPSQEQCRRLDTSDPTVWTAHEAIDTERILAGSRLLLSGHTFYVHSMNFLSTGSPTGDPRRGQDFMAGIGQVDLKLTHAQWMGCPAAERPGKRMPKAWRETLDELRAAALRLLAHPETTAADAEFLRAHLAPLVDLVL